MVSQHLLLLAVTLALLSSSISEARPWPKVSSPPDEIVSSSTSSSSQTEKDKKTLASNTHPNPESNSLGFKNPPLNKWMSLDELEDNALTFDCFQGVPCKLNFKTSSFNAFNNSIQIVSKHRSHNWMIYKSDQTFVGVPLKSGLFEYLLKFSDEQGKEQSLPFAVNVKAITSANQKIVMWIDQPSVKEFKKSPSLIFQLVEDFANALKIATNQLSVTHMMQLGNITQVTFQEVNVSDIECDYHRLKVLKDKMVTADNKMKEKFIQSMRCYHEIHNIEFWVSSKCLAQLAPLFTTTLKTVTSGIPGISTTTTADPPLKETIEMFLSLSIACGLFLSVGVCWFGWRVNNQPAVHNQDDMELGLVGNIVEETDHVEERIVDIQNNLDLSGDEESSSV